MTETPAPEPAPLPVLPPPNKTLRKPDEMIVAGQFFSTGTRVVTWLDAGGYNAYAPRPGVPPAAARFPDHYGARRLGTPPKEKNFAYSGDGPRDLADLRKHVDQFVLHYDECGLSKTCFRVLHIERGLSIHFMLDIDGTIYQTLDLRERAFHATTSNSRSIGIEIANIGAHSPGAAAARFKLWYPRDEKGKPRLTPAAQGDHGLFNKNYAGRPVRDALVKGAVQGRALEQYDLTPEQYEALIKLTAALSRVFPEIKLDYPRDAAGKLVTKKLPDASLEHYHGVLGHYHIQANKLDPGPAMDWEKVITGARSINAAPPPEKK
ncbi:N-acetylmuramoyl-L-alanine amidase [Oleiharenicola lentus]|uniref:N-acetylmuramoyl-L-alanine amidase n=1 Tax=Oleiharenicola lentus TaxID=2508720 RepID=UPI003F67433E